MGPFLWIHLWLLPVLVADLVAIESDPSDPRLAEIAIESCNDALGAGRCRAVSEPGATPTWHVRVIWQPPERLRARVEIRRAAEPDALASVRVVEFSAADDLAQRNRAIGLIIAAYVVEQTPVVPEPEPPPVGEPPPTPPPAEPADEPEDDAPSPPPRVPVWSADLALLAGPGLDRGPPRLGAMLRGLARPFEVPLAALLALRAARRFDDDAVLWLGGAAGLAVHLRTLPALAFELRGEFALERVYAEAQDAQSGLEESGDAIRYGGRLGLEAHVVLGRHFGLFAGGELSALVPSVYLDIRGQRTGQDRPLGWGGLLGVRLAD